MSGPLEDILAKRNSIERELHLHEKDKDDHIQLLLSNHVNDKFDQEFSAFEKTVGVVTGLYFLSPLARLFQPLQHKMAWQIVDESLKLNTKKAQSVSQQA